ncbi:uncharacterized protein LOC121405684 isoform X2 [Lytechinus variegatus]|uniref:uncharacterized protein LOC121405684 isoform X2 n=1 Tax=Lytechinus variegatus TaxID=7654 RepID=UPI001BB28BEE|nr:uncharacterized protein LOC121405684 isoform X2 [Lytechinus variegatus]
MGDDLFVIYDSEDEEYPSTSSGNSHRRSGGVRSRENLTPNQSEKVGNNELESDVILLSSDSDSDSDSDLPDPFARGNDDGTVKRKKKQKKNKKKQKKNKKKVNVESTECQTRHARVKQEVNESYEDLAFQAEKNCDSDQDNSRHLRNEPTSEDSECDDREEEAASGSSKGNPQQQDAEGLASDEEGNIITLHDLDSETYSQVAPVEPYFSPFDLHSPVNHVTSPLSPARTSCTSPSVTQVPQILLQRLPPNDLPSSAESSSGVDNSGNCSGDLDLPNPSCVSSSASPGSPSVTEVPQVLLQRLPPNELPSSSDSPVGVNVSGECSGDLNISNPSSVSPLASPGSPSVTKEPQVLLQKLPPNDLPLSTDSPSGFDSSDECSGDLDIPNPSCVSPSASPGSPSVTKEPQVLLQKLPPNDLPLSTDSPSGFDSSDECSGDLDIPNPSCVSPSASPGSPSVTKEPQVLLQKLPPDDSPLSADSPSGINSPGEWSDDCSVNDTVSLSTSGRSTGVHTCTSDDSSIQHLLAQALRSEERMQLKIYRFPLPPASLENDSDSDETCIEDDDLGTSLNQVDNCISEPPGSDESFETSEVNTNFDFSGNDDECRRPVRRCPVVSDDDTDSDETCIDDDDQATSNEVYSSKSESSSSDGTSVVYPSSSKNTCPSRVETEDDFSEPFSPSGGAEPNDQMGNTDGFDTQPFQPVLDDQIEYSSSMHRDTSSPEQNFATDCTEQESDVPGGSSDQEEDGPLDNSTGQYFPTDSQLSCSLDSEDTEDLKSLSAEGTACHGQETESGLSNLSNGHSPGRDIDCPDKSAGKKTLPCLRHAWSPSELDPQQRFLMLQGDESECISFSQNTPSDSAALSPALSHCETQDIHVSTLSPDNSMTIGSKKRSPKKKNRLPNLSRGEKLLSTLKENVKQREKNETTTAQDSADIPSTSNPSNKSHEVSSQTPSTSVKDIPSIPGNQPSSSSVDSSETPSKFGNLSVQGHSSLSHSNEVCFEETMQVDSRTSRDNPSVSTPTKSTVDNGRTAPAGISNGLGSAPTGVLSNAVGRSISCGHPSVFTPSASASVTNGRRASTGMPNGPSSEPNSRSISSGHPSVSTPSSPTVTNGRTTPTSISNKSGSASTAVLSNGVSRSFNPRGTSYQQRMETRMPPKKRWHQQTSSVPSGSRGSEVTTMTEETGIKETLSCILSWKYDWISRNEGVPSANVLQSFLGCREVPRHQDSFQDVGSYQMSLICFLLLEMWSKVSSAVDRTCDVVWRQISWPKGISEDIAEVNYEPIDSSHQGLSSEDLVLVDMTAINAAENQYQFGLVRGVSDGTVTLALPYKNKVVPSSTRLKIVTSLSHYMNQIRALLSFQNNPLARHIAQPEDLSVFVKDGKPPPEGKVSDDALLKSLMMSMSRSAQQQKLIRLMNGPPGTGKTAFLGRFIRRIINEHRDIPKTSKNPYKLLVCAPTRQSLDVLLRKIWEYLLKMGEIKTDGEAISHQKNIVNGVQIVRVGEEADKRLEEFLLSTVLARKKEQGAELDDADLQTKILQGADIVGCTLKDCGSKIVRESLEGNVFALIVDDACHCLETELLLALQCKTKRVFLVGDREQEIIHIHSKEAKELGFGRSMLTRIAQKFAMEDQNTCIHNWDTQYRMEAEIAKYPSSVMYLHKLKTGKKQESFFLRRYIIFDVSDGKESMQGESLVNTAEASFIKELVCSFSGKEKFSIGIIAHTDGQRDLLKVTLEGQKILKPLVGTPADFFGLEKDVIILCCTRTGGTPDDYGFLMSKQVLNLVLTRAKFSLIIVGNMTRIKEFANWNYLVDDATGRKLVFRTSKASYREDAQNCRERYSQANTSRRQSGSHTPRTENRGSAAGHQQRVGQPGLSLIKSVGRSSPGDQSRLGTSGSSPLTGSEVQVLPGYQQTWNGQCPTTVSEASQGLQQRREQAGPSNGMELVFESRHNPRHEGNPANGNSQDPMEEVLTHAIDFPGHPDMDSGSRPSEALVNEGSNLMIEEHVQHNRKVIVADQTRAVEVPCHGQEENRRSILRQVSVDNDKGNRGKRRVSFDTTTEDHQRPAKVPRTNDSAQETSSQINSSTSRDYPQTSRGSSQPRGILKKPQETIPATSHGNGLRTDQDKPRNTHIPQRQRGNGSSYIPNYGSDNRKNLHEIAVGLRNNERISRKGNGISIGGRTFGKFRPQKSSRRKDNNLRSKMRHSGEDADAGMARCHQDLHSHGSNRQQEDVDQYPHPLSHSHQSLYERPENRRSERRQWSDSTNEGTFQSRLGSHGNRRGRSSRRRRNNDHQRGRSNERSQRQSRQEPLPERRLERLESLDRLATDPAQPERHYQRLESLDRLATDPVQPERHHQRLESLDRLATDPVQPERHLQRLESLNRLATNPVQLDPTMEHHRLVNQASGGRSTELTAPLPNVRRRKSCNPVKDSQMDYQD